MFHQQFWFFVVNYMNKDIVMGEVIFSTLRILMDPMQLTLKETKDFLSQYMGRTLTYLEEDRKKAQEKISGFQLWTLDEIIKAFRQLNEQRILREKSQNINTLNSNNKKQHITQELDKNIYTFKPNIDKNSQIIDEKHKKKFLQNQNQIQIDVSPIRNSNETQNKSNQSTNKIINLLQSSSSNQNLHSNIQQNQGLESINNKVKLPGQNGLNHSQSTNFLKKNNEINQYNNDPHNFQNETHITSDYRSTAQNTENANFSIEQSNQFFEKNNFKQNSQMSQNNHPSGYNINQNNQNFYPSHNLYQGVRHGISGEVGGKLDFEDDQGQSQQKLKRCTTLSSFQIPEEDYCDDISQIPSNNFEKPIDRVNMMLQKKQLSQKKINHLKEQVISEQMKECTFQPQIQRSISPQYSAYTRNQKDLITRQQAQTHRNQMKQEQIEQEIQSYSFQPSISPPQRFVQSINYCENQQIQNQNKIRQQLENKSPKTPKGYEQTVYRMRAAYEGQKQSHKLIDQGSYANRAQAQRTPISPQNEIRQSFIDQYQGQKQQNMNEREQTKTENLISKQKQKQQQSNPPYQQKILQDSLKLHQEQYKQIEEQYQSIQQPLKQMYENSQKQSEQFKVQNDQRQYQQGQIQGYQQQYQQQREIQNTKQVQQNIQEDQQHISKPKIKPFFVLDIITPNGEKAFLELYKDDDIYEKAENFSKQYNLDEITQSRIEQILDQQMQNYMQKSQHNKK